MAFQHYFVRDRCEPAVTGFDFEGVEDAALNPLITTWLADCDAVIICPSNPFVSVDPMLALGGFRAELSHKPVIAVSPIVGGLAIKGPAAKMMAELNVPASAAAVADYYGQLLTGFILDDTDAEQADQIAVPTRVTNTIMDSLDARVDLAKACLEFAAEMADRRT